MYDSLMSFDPITHVNGSGSQGSASQSNFILANHNDRLFLLAKTKLEWNDFVNFTTFDDRCLEYESISDLLEEGERTGLGVARKDLRFLLTQYVLHKIRYTNKIERSFDKLQDN